MSRRSVLLLAVSLVGLTAPAAGGVAASVTSTPSPSPPPVVVVVAAEREAVALGDPHPASAVYVLTRRQAAARASSGGTVNSNQPVYLIVLTGRFTTDPVGPYPGRRVHGTIASEVLSAANGRDTDFSIGPKPISTARLGPTGNLLPYLDGAERPACRTQAWTLSRSRPPVVQLVRPHRVGRQHVQASRRAASSRPARPADHNRSRLDDRPVL